MERKIGVYICECGPNIAEKIDIDTVIKAITPLDDVVVVEKFKLLCSTEGKEFLGKEITKHKLTHLVVAACSPKEHEKTFMTVCEQASLNPYLFQLANIREQCAWITDDKDEATAKAIRLIKAAIGRVRYHSPLEKKEIDSNPDVLVIGGGIAGIETALQLASPQRTVYLVEKSASLGGVVQHFEKVFDDMMPTKDLLQKKVQAIEQNEHIKVFTESTVDEAIGFFGNFEIKVASTTQQDTFVSFDVGAIVIAIGAALYDLSSLKAFGYGTIDNVVSSLDFEQMNASGAITLKNGRPPTSVALIHCVGRTDVGYCSDVCCLYSLKHARYLKEKVPKASIIHFYSDLCIPGKAHQQFYEDTKSPQVNFLRSHDIKLTKQKDQIRISYSTEQHKQKTTDVDMVILAPAIVPADDATTVAEITGISQGETGFFSEEHEKLNPISTATDGIYIVGCAHGPKNIADSIIQSEAASGKILSALIPGRKLEPEVKTSTISESLCIGCKTCLEVCSYGAISYDEKKNISVVNEVICRGCGNCVAACPSGAARIKHFNFNQLYQELVEAMK